MKKILLFVFLFLAIIGKGQTLIDSYNESNMSTSQGIYAGATYVSVGQSFTNTVQDTLRSCKFYLKKVGAPTDNITVSVYAVTGTYGTSSCLPTGAVLATADPVSAASLTLSNTLITFTFSGANKIILSANTYYCLILSYNFGNSSNIVSYGVDATSSTHAGNYIRGTATPVWSSIAYDMIFYVYGNSTGGVITPKQSLFFNPF